MDLLYAFGIATLTGITEEIFYRGIILNQLMQYKGKFFALIISSLIFALAHTQYYHQFNNMFYVFIMAILLGYLYIITRSLFISIGVHFAVDFYLIMSDGYNKVLLFNLKSNNLDMYFSYAQIFVILILILILAVYRFKHKKTNVNT